MYRLLSELAKKLLVVTVTHDLNLALQFSSRILILDNGCLAGDGGTAEVLTPERIERVFGVHAQVHPGKPPHMTPHMTYEA
jgi:iron complex transport system ATP-binding protein